MGRLNLLLTTAIAVCVATPSFAQEGAIAPSTAPAAEGKANPLLPEQAQEGSSTSEAASGALEDIVVTAQKREQNLQDVPVAVSAFTADTLTNRNVATVSDLPRLAPSLTVTQGNVPTNNSINLRGIGTTAFSTGIEPSVAVIVDDVALVQQAQAFSGLSDIARIEVLRGPQGTLFGKNASAGAINIVSQGPSAALSGGVTLTATTDEEYRADAVLSGPLAQGIGFRLNGFYGNREGYIRNLTDGRKLNNDESYGVRGRLLLDPASNLTVDLVGSYSVAEGDGIVRTYRAVPANSTVYGASIAPSLVGITPGTNNFRVRVDGPFFNRSKNALGSARVTLDLGIANLVSITAYQDWRFRFTEDFDLIQGPVLGLANGIVAGSTYHAHQFSQELRVVSKGGAPLTYVFGLFYSNGETERTFDRGPLGPVRALWNSSSGSRTFASFAQATYDIMPTTHIDGGLRANRERVDATFQNLVPTTTPPAGNATCLALCAGQATDSQLTGKIALRQDLAERVMGYLSYATGYKGQGFDVSTGFTPRRAANPVRPEHSKAYEVGLKSRFLDNRVQLNVAGFWSDFDGFQAQSGILLPDNTIQLTLNNVGKVRTRGVEVEASAKPLDALRLDGAFTYTDAVIRSFPGAQCYTGQTVAQGCVDLDGAGPSTVTGQNRAGGRLPNAPKYKANIGATYDVALPSLPFNGFVQGDVSYQSRVNFDLLGNPFSVQNGYALVNASLGIDQEAKGFRVALFVQNLFNKHYAASVTQTGGGPLGLIQQNLSRNSRRYGGIRARYSF